MTSPAEDRVQSEPSVPDAAGLALETFDRNLSAIRRTAAFGSREPSSVRFAESNLGRWLDPLLEQEVPDPLRELLVALGGQISGLDEIAVDSRKRRYDRIRQVVHQLDRLLGLPLGQTIRPPRKTRPPKRDSEKSPKPPKAVSGKSRRGKAPKSDSRPRERSSSKARAFWDGNPHHTLEGLGIDPELSDALRAAGIQTVGDLLRTAPTHEEILRPIHGAGRDLPKGRVAVGGRLASRVTVCHSDGSRTVLATLRGAGPLRLRWRNTSTAGAWLDGLQIGDRVVVVGTWDGESLLDPEFVTEDGKTVRMQRYGIEGVEDRRLHQLLFRLLPSLDALKDPLSTSRRGGQMGLADAFRALHGRGDAAAARQRVAFDEAVTVSVAASWSRLGQRVRGIQHAILHTAASRLLARIDLQLSDSQQLALEDIKRDLRRVRPMRRVLIGDPGGAKGLLGTLTALTVAEGKCQVLWLCEDEAKAEFAFTFNEPHLRSAGFVGRHVGSSIGASVRDATKRGEIHVLFAPASVLGAPLEFRRLGLVISQEGARSEPVDVEALKSPRPDLLVLPSQHPSAPDLLSRWPSYDITALVGGPTPDVVVRPASRRDAAYAPARQAVAEGEQVLVLFPQIQGRDALDPAEAQRMVAALREQALQGARVALLHGAMPPDERVRVVEDFVSRRADALVSTLPMEDGPPVPGHTITVVEHAERMSPQRVLRLRGLPSRQISLVVGDDFPEERHEGLALRVRGATEPEQAPVELPAFRFFDPMRDRDLLVAARAVAFELLTLDGGLRSGHHAELVRSMRAAWVGLFGDVPCPLPEVADPGDRKRRRRRRRRR